MERAESDGQEGEGDEEATEQEAAAAAALMTVVEVEPMEHTTQVAEQVELSTVQDEDVKLAVTQTISVHRQHMEEFLCSILLKQKKHHLMTEEKYNFLLHFLRDPVGTKCDPKFRHWATRRHDFALQVEDVEGLTVEKIVVSVTIMDKFREFEKGGRRTLVTVIPTSALFDVSEDIHVNKLDHGGYKRVKLYAEDYYYGITRAYVQEFCRSCPVCQEGPRPRNSITVNAALTPRRTPLRPVVKRVLACPNTAESLRPTKFARRVVKQPVATQSVRNSVGKAADSGEVEVTLAGEASGAQFMASVQVDLIDMSATPDGDYRHMCHFLDFFSKYHVLFPLRNNSANEIAMGLRDRVFAYFGPARKVYMGAGKQFVEGALSVLAELWPDTTIIQGKACDAVSPQKILKMVECEVASIRKDVQLEDSACFPWATHLAQVMFTLNARKPDPKLDTPYGVVLGHPPLTATPLPGLGGRVIEEEQLDHLIGELLA